MSDLGCKCQGCGEHYRVDLNIPDDLWNHIRPTGTAPGAGLLCGSCILVRIERQGGFGVLHARRGDDDGRVGRIAEYLKRITRSGTVWRGSGSPAISLLPPMGR